MGGLQLTLRFVKVSKLIEFLQCSRNAKTEARVDITCMRKTQRTKNSNRGQSRKCLRSEVGEAATNITHFVSEMVEGGTFKKSCNITKEADKMSVDLFKKLKNALTKSFGVSGVHRETDFEQFEVNIQCPFAISITSFDDVMSQAKTLPERLKQYNNTLLVRLLPIHLILPNVVQTVYRPINDQTLKQLISTNRRAENNDYELENLTFNETFCEDLLLRQRNSFQGNFKSSIDEFRNKVKTSLPAIGSESDNSNICLCELVKSANRVEQECLKSEKYSELRKYEEGFLDNLDDGDHGFIAAKLEGLMENSDWCNNLNRMDLGSHIQQERPKIVKKQQFQDRLQVSIQIVFCNNSVFFFSFAHLKFYQTNREPSFRSCCISSHFRQK